MFSREAFLFGFVVSGLSTPPPKPPPPLQQKQKQMPLQYSRRVLLKTTYVCSWPCIASNSRRSTDPRVRRVHLVGQWAQQNWNVRPVQSTRQKLVVEDGQPSLSDDVAWRREPSSVIFEDVKGPGEGTDRGLCQSFLP